MNASVTYFEKTLAELRRFLTGKGPNIDPRFQGDEHVYRATLHGFAKLRASEIYPCTPSISALCARPLSRRLSFERLRIAWRAKIAATDEAKLQTTLPAAVHVESAGRNDLPSQWAT